MRRCNSSKRVVIRSTACIREAVASVCEVLEERRLLSAPYDTGRVYMIGEGLDTVTVPIFESSDKTSPTPPDLDTPCDCGGGRGGPGAGRGKGAESPGS